MPLSLQIYAVKKVWFKVDALELAKIPDHLREEFLSAKVREELSKISIIEYEIHTDFSTVKIPEIGPKEKIIL